MKKQFLIHIYFTADIKACIFCSTVENEIFHFIISFWRAHCNTCEVIHFLHLSYKQENTHICVQVYSFLKKCAPMLSTESSLPWDKNSCRAKSCCVGYCQVRGLKSPSQITGKLALHILWPTTLMNFRTASCPGQEHASQNHCELFMEAPLLLSLHRTPHWLHHSREPWMKGHFAEQTCGAGLG